MAWTIAVICGVLGLSFIFLFLSTSFEKSRSGMKVFLIMLSLATTILLSQIIKLIISDKATGATSISLSNLSTALLTISITLFSFFMMYFLVIYTRNIVRGVRDSKESKLTETLGEL